MYTRGLGPAASADPRLWSVKPSATKNAYIITSSSTGRCLAANASGTAGLIVTLLPCVDSPLQQWTFDKGAHTVTSVTNVGVGMALAVGNETLFSAQYGKDAFPVSAAAYGEAGLILVPPYDQANCTSRDCQNYDPSQMWFYSASDSLFRQATYTASINHKNGGDGYTLTSKVPTYQHHCLSHVLSNQNEGTQSGVTEVWGGPLASTSTTSASSPDFVIALVNTGTTAATIAAEWAMLEYPGIDKGSAFKVTDLWAGAAVQTQAGGFSASIGPHDIGIYRLTAV
jgi:hypothetical protein